MTEFLYDSAVFLYAVGADHPYRDPCVQLVRLAGTGELRGHASVELLQEVAHVRSRRTGDRRAGTELARLVTPLVRLHPLEPADVTLALALYDAHPALHVRDAIHAATAVGRGLPVIVSPDRAFDAVAGLRRVDPVDAAAELARR